MYYRRHARYGMPKLPVRSEHSSQTGDVQKNPDPDIPADAGGKQKWHPHPGCHSAGTIVARLRRRDQADDIHVTPNVTRLFLSREALASSCQNSRPSQQEQYRASHCHSSPNSLLQWRYVSADARLVHCHHQVPFPCLSPPRKRTGASWNSTCGRYSKGPHSTHVPTTMAGPPLRLSIDPKVKPITAHKATAVPVHWEEKVKAHLDRDVRLGVLEKVPIGTPDTWCDRREG